MNNTITIDPAALPLRPGTATQVLELLDDPDNGASQISELVRTEPAITARLLALANSPVFSRGKAIADINRAIIVVGLSAVRGIALGVAMDSLFEDHADLDPGHWDHAVLAAGAALATAGHVGADPGEAFCAGLMLDMGQIAMAINSAANWALVVEQTAVNTPERLAFETEMFATDHAQLGSEVLKGFRLPSRLVIAVSAHHQPPATIDYPLGRCVAVATVIAELEEVGGEREPDEALSELGLDQRAIREETRQQVSVLQMAFSR